MHVISTAEIVLQVLQALREFLDSRGGIKTRKQFGGVTQLLERDAQPVPLWGRLLGKAPTSALHCPTATIEHCRHDLPNRPLQFFRYPAFLPLATIEPTEQAQYQRAVARRSDGFSDCGIRSIPPVMHGVCETTELSLICDGVPRGIDAR